MSSPSFSQRVGITAVAAALLLGSAYAWQQGWLSSSELTWKPTVIQQRIPYNITLSASAAPARSQPTVFTLTVKQGGRLDDLLGRAVLAHVTVTSNNGADMWFYHAGSDLLEVKPGVYSFTHTFSQAAPYTLWIELNDNISHDHHGATSEYIGRLDLPLGTSDMAVAPISHTTTDGIYTLRVEPVTPLAAQQPTRLKFTATDKDGKPVSLLTNVDHYFAVTGENHYELWHPDAAASSAAQVTTAPLLFPHTGTYNVFVRLFANSGTPESPQLGAEITGVFVLAVP